MRLREQFPSRQLLWLLSTWRVTQVNITHVRPVHVFELQLVVFMQQVKVCTLWAVLCEFSQMQKLEPQKLKRICRNRKTFFKSVATRCVKIENSPELWVVGVLVFGSGMGAWLKFNGKRNTWWLSTGYYLHLWVFVCIEKLIHVFVEWLVCFGCLECTMFACDFTLDSLGCTWRYHHNEREQYYLE